MSAGSPTPPMPSVIEDFRREHRIPPQPYDEPWVEEHNTVLNYLCDLALASASSEKSAPQDDLDAAHETCTRRCYVVAEEERCADCPSRLSQAASSSATDAYPQERVDAVTEVVRRSLSRLGDKGQLLNEIEEELDFHRDSMYEDSKMFQLLEQAFEALSAPSTIEPQPVAWRHRSMVDGEWTAWRHQESKPQGPAGETFEFQPLFSAPSAKKDTARLDFLSNLSLDEYEEKIWRPEAEFRALIDKAMAPTDGESAT